MLADSLTEHMLKNGARMHDFANAYVETRARRGLPPVPVKNIVDARAVEIVAERMRRVDLLTDRNVAAAVRSTQAVVWRAERQRQFDRLVKTVVADAHLNSARYGHEAEIEIQARARRGMPRVPVKSMIVALAMQEVIERVPTSRLTIEDTRSARLAILRIDMPHQVFARGLRVGLTARSDSSLVVYRAAA